MKTKLISMLSAVIAALSVSSKDCCAEEVWGFFDVGSGTDAFLSKAEKTLAVGEFGEYTEFCEDESAFYCFFTPRLNLAVAIPKGPTRLKSWKYKGYTFCVIQNRDELTGSGKMILVGGYKGDDCEGDSLEMFVYSPVRGLVFLRGDPNSSGRLELLSTQDNGFGAIKQ